MSSTTEKYTFLSFCLDLIYINRALFGGRFSDFFERSKFIILKTIDYTFYNAMCYVRNQYDCGNFRLTDEDYNNKDYVINAEKRPYVGITVGLRPTNYTDFFYLLMKLAWWDMMGYIQRNPVICLILYIIYSYFPLVTVFLYFCTFIYISYSLFDR